MKNCINQGFVIDLDIKGYFDTIDHELLLKGLTHYCKDKWVEMYVKRWLEAGVITETGMYQDSKTGTPQGGVIKWIKWEKGLYGRAAKRWLKTIYKDLPGLFLHWRWVHP